MRYAIALTSALLLGGATATLALQPEARAQNAPGVAQNEPGAIAAAAPRVGAPMSFADMVARLQPAVVNISTTQTVKVAAQDNGIADLFSRMFPGMPAPGGNGGGAGPSTREAQSLGSGFVISADGYIVTNNHVISAGNRNATVDTITVTLPDRTEYPAKLIGRDPSSDLAVLKIEPKSTLAFVKFGDSARARVGDWVVAIGNPFGLGSTVTAGIVSALHRVTGQGGAYDRFIQTDASINQGNSGGPMFNLNGDVIGINSQILSPTGGNVGIGFAIPAEEAKPIIDTLMGGKTITRGYLGVSIQRLTDDLATGFGLAKGTGELISRVEPTGAAAKAGIQRGDVVVKVGGDTVTPDSTLSYLAAKLAPGARVPIELIRDGKRQTVTVTVGTRPSEEQLAALVGADSGADTFGSESESTTPQSASAALGFSAVPITEQIRGQLGLGRDVAGLIVNRVDPASQNAGALAVRDVIVSVNGIDATSPAVLNAEVAKAKAAGRNRIVLFRQRVGAGGNFVAVRIAN
ncbi:MAG: Do family serine endopeptidase [Pseudomonadota bacterium]